jgi:hypothetical protein
MCTFGIHTIYSCIDGFFFNPTSGKCQYLPVVRNSIDLINVLFFKWQKNGVNCVEIMKQMGDIDFLPLAQPVKGKEKLKMNKMIHFILRF